MTKETNLVVLLDYADNQTPDIKHLIENDENCILYLGIGEDETDIKESLYKMTYPDDFDLNDLWQYKITAFVCDKEYKIKKAIVIEAKYREEISYNVGGGYMYRRELTRQK